MLARELFRFRRASIGTDEGLDVMRSAVQRDLQKVVFVLRRGDTRDRADLRVADLASLHGCCDLRQLLQRVRRAHLLARRAQVDAALPIEPVRAVLRRATVPALATIELGDESEKAIVRRVEMADQLDDLSASSCVERM